ncbi:MAG: GAF domain-containing protein [Pedobacter sp.]|nr:MAG: GAF domain-containing protein [Pedobacter sp.]
MIDKKQYDSEFCGNLPISFINSIQDYGYLYVLRKDDLSIIQVSENVAELLNTNVQQLIGLSFESILEASDYQKLVAIIAKDNALRIPVKLAMKSGDKGYYALVHVFPDYILVEMELEGEMEGRQFTDVFQQVRQLSAAIDHAKTVQEVCEIAVRELRILSGFDGVLMYTFDEYWNGRVIAEDKDERLEVYLGQTFPASDVPKQARELYLKNPYRLIPNRNYAASRLYPVINPITNAFTDLSSCNLRGVAGVHLEYMKNMGVMASMSIRVIKNEQLWALISCHNIETKYLDYEICSVFEWLSMVISNRITVILNQEEYQSISDLQTQRTNLSDQVYAQDSIVDGLLAQEDNNLLRLFNSGGAAVILDGRTETIGNVPQQEELENLALWLEGKNVNKIFSTSNLASTYEDAANYAAEGSGILVIPVDSEKADYVICFRPEKIETIDWGGNPNEAINFEPDQKTYHPRNSFKLWKEKVYMHSEPWQPKELEVAESLRSFLFEFRTKQLYN